MNKELTKFCDAQYREFESELRTSWGIEARTIGLISDKLKFAYRKYLSFATLCSVLSIDEERSSYIKSAPEAYLLSLVMIAKGLENPAHVLMRQSIEMSLKHIYFSTHPVEYNWSQTRINYREINFQFLLDYLRKTDDLDGFSTKEGMVQRLEEHFHVLSRYVHVHSIKFTTFSKSASIFSKKTKFLEGITNQLADLISLEIVILIGFFKDKFLSIPANEKSLIMNALTGLYDSEFKIFLKNLPRKD